MKKQDFDAFSEIFVGIAESYEKVPSPQLVKLYFALLEELSLEEIQSAAARYMRDPVQCKFMPKPGDLIGIARPKRTATMAWADVVEEMGRIDSYASIKFEDGVINAVIKDLGGWPWICMQDLDEPWTQKEFERRYDQYKAAGIASKEHLVGHFEADNREKGLTGWIRPPYLSGVNRGALPEAGDRYFLKQADRKLFGDFD